MATIFGGKRCADPAALYSECVASRLPTDRWLGKANAFTLTAGREPGRGSVLLRSSDLDALDATADHNLTFSGTDARRSVTLSPVTLLGYECMSPGAPDDGDATYLCEVVDRRHHLKRIAFAAGYRAYNVSQADGAAFQTGTLNAGSPWTWANLLTDLSGLLGITAVTVPFTPNGQPENLIFRAGPWDALNDVLARLACVLTYDPVKNTFATVRLGEKADDPLKALEAGPDYLGRVWDGYSGESARGWRPEKVRVLFLRRPQPTGTGGESPYYAADITLPTAKGVVTGSVVELADDRTALGATGTPSNSAALTTRAQERADDWLRQREGVGRPFVRAWRDIQPLAIGAVGQSVSRVTFDDRGEAIRTVAASVSGKDLEEWRPLGGYPPWWPVASGATVSAWKSPPCRAATTAALPSYNYSNGASGAGATITAFSNGALPAQDGVTLVAGDDLLVKNEPTSPAYAPFGGLYTITQVGSVSTPFILTRRADADAGSELLGATVTIMEGTVNGNSIWKCTNVAPITIGTTALTWAKVYPPQLTGDSISSGSIVTLAADDTWYQFPTTFTLPSAGTYLFTGVCGVTARMNGGAPGLVKVHLFNITAGIQIGGDYPASVEVSAFNTTFQVVPITLKLTVTGPTTFCYRGLRYVASSGATWSNASLGGGFTPVTYGWLKLTD